MKIILISLFSIFITSVTFSQGGWTRPNNSYGIMSNRQSVDSAFLFPTGCGAPTSLKAYDLKKAAIYLDTCSHRLWFYDPSHSAWDSAHLGSIIYSATDSSSYHTITQLTDSSFSICRPDATCDTIVIHGTGGSGSLTLQQINDYGNRTTTKMQFPVTDSTGWDDSTVVNKWYVKQRVAAALSSIPSYTFTDGIYNSGGTIKFGGTISNSVALSFSNLNSIYLGYTGSGGGWYQADTTSALFGFTNPSRIDYLKFDQSGMKIRQQFGPKDGLQYYASERDTSQWSQYTLPDIKYLNDRLGSFTTTESDPVFTAHTTHNITNGTGFLKNNGSGTWSYDNNTYLTSINGITAGGSLSGTYPNPTIANSGVSAGTYYRPKITVAADGRITNAVDFANDTTQSGTYSQRIALGNVPAGYIFYQTNERIGLWVKSPGIGSRSWYFYGSPDSYIYGNSNGLSAIFGTATSGTGATVNNSGFTPLEADSKIRTPYGYRFTSGTVTNSYAGFWTDQNANSTSALTDTNYVYVVYGTWIFPTAPNGTDDYAFKFGFADNDLVSSATDVNGYYFKFNNSSAGSNVECVTQSASVQTTVNSGVSIASIADYYPHTFTIHCNSQRGVFFIDGVQVANITTNIPTSFVQVSSMSGVTRKLAGSTNISSYLYDRGSYSVKKY